MRDIEKCTKLSIQAYRELINPQKSGKVISKTTL